MLMGIVLKFLGCSFKIVILQEALYTKGVQLPIMKLL